MISVVVPVYNVEAYFVQCLDSILYQTYQDLEILLIDDGSQDRCGELCDKYALIDPRIRVFHTENRGLSAARNFGIEQAQGEYIGFVDSDDWIEPHMYERLLCAIEEGNRIDIAICGRYWEYPDKTETFLPLSGILDRDEAIKALAKSEIRNGVWDKLYRRKCFYNIRFPEGRVYEDVATTYRVFLNADRLVCIAEPLYHYRTRKGSITNDESYKNVLDLFVSEREEYENIALVAPYYTDEVIRNALLTRCASAIIRMWMSFDSVPANEKKTFCAELKKAARFVQTNYPVFGLKNWSCRRRCFLFFCRYFTWWSPTIVMSLKRVKIGLSKMKLLS